MLPNGIEIAYDTVMPQPKSRVTATLTAKMKKEWKEWLQSHARVDRKRKIIKIEAPPPTWLCRAILEKRLHDTPGCVDILRTLRAEGCDASVLLRHLEEMMCSQGIDLWKKLAGGLRPRQIRAAAKQMRKCAEEIQVLNSGFASKVYFHQYPDSAPFLALPAQLTALAGLWELLIKGLGRVQPDSRKRLMKHVYERTGKFHYEEMASLIGAALDSQFDAVALRKWCSKQGLTKPKRNTAAAKK
jgi:hypothetical protein